MALTLQKSLRRALFVGRGPLTEPVTLFVRVAPGMTPTTGGVTLYRAWRRDAPKRDDAPAVGREEVTWLVTQPDLDRAGVKLVKVSDVVADSAGVRWSVLDVERRHLNAEWRLHCVRERPA